MRFRFNATRWRGVRLQFTAKWGEVYRASWPVFAFAAIWAVGFSLIERYIPKARGTGSIGAALGIGLACGILSILCAIRLEYNYKSLLVARARIGGQAGRWKPVFGDFVKIWVATLGVFLLSVLLVGVAIAVGLGGSFALLRNLKGSGPLVVVFAVGMAILGIFVLFLASGPARAYREARVFQLVWNNIGVSHVARFRCDLKVSSVKRMLRIRSHT